MTSSDPTLATASVDGCCVLPGETLERLPSAVLVVMDADLRVVRSEGRGCEEPDVGAARVTGRRFEEIVPGQLLDAVRQRLEAVLAGEEHSLELRDPERRFMYRLTLMPRRDAQGSVDGVVAFCWDAACASSKALADESERRYRLLAESATDVVSLRDPDGRYRYVSPSAVALSGFLPEELVGRPASEYVHPDDREQMQAAFARLLAGEEVVELEYRVLHRNGSCVWARTTMRALREPDSGEVTSVRTSTRNVTERRAREAKLLATTAELKLRLRQTAAIAELGEHALEEPSLERFLADATTKVAEILDVPLCSVLVDDGRRGGGLRMRAGTGWRAGTVGRSIVSRDGAAGWLRRLARAPVVFTGLPPDPSWRQLLQEHGVLSSMWVVLTDREQPFGALAVHRRSERAFTDDDRTFLVAVVNVLRDAIARHRAEEAARHDALHDELTGLSNRRLLTDRLGHALARSARSGTRHAVLFLDIDHFKLVNDSLGHDAGDRLLRAFGSRLRSAVRPEDTVARFGGDEFVVLCEDVGNEQHAVSIARSLTGAVHRSFDLDGRAHVASASVGVAVTNGVPCTPEEVLRDADTAMYRAKEAGRGRFEVFNTGMRHRTLARLELEDELRRALVRDELVVHYQPIHAIDVEVPATIEALVRWRHPERGLLLPGTFIPLAEETNLIGPLGDQVLRRACSQTALWRETLPAARELTVSVNVSARQIARPAFPAEVAGILSQTGLPPHALCLEITEGVLLQDSAVSAAAIANLRARGIRIVLDDFGTGYCSLGYLRRYALDLLKIDRSFVSGLADCIEDRVIVQAIITMAHALALDITAEGVETAEQLQVLRELGCSYVQGYLLARPMAAEELEARLRGLEHTT
ncbi:MAG: EAL domain-containing protein [Solirubrobacteraceae bacterium]